jgi:hypothetical protein
LHHAASGTYHEVKSCGSNGTALIYEVGHNRQARFIGSGQRLYYWFFHHTADASTVRSRYELNRLLSVSLRHAIALPFESVMAECAARPTRVLCNAKSPAGKKNGYTENGYGVGWAIPLSALRARTVSMRYISDLRYPVAFPLYVGGNAEGFLTL